MNPKIFTRRLQQKSMIFKLFTTVISKQHLNLCMVKPSRIVLWNSNGIQSENLEVDVFLNFNNSDILLASETHFTSRTYKKIPYCRSIKQSIQIIQLTVERPPAPTALSSIMRDDSFFHDLGGIRQYLASVP